MKLENLGWLIAAILFAVLAADFNFKRTGEAEQLAAENLNLKIAVEELSRKAGERQKEKNFSQSRASHSFLLAKTYVSYPLNTKNRIIVGAGETDGVTVKMAALSSDGFLIGEVAAVSARQAVIKTIFDADWQTSVRVGKDEANGVLSGGTEPKVTFLPKTVARGDKIVSADPRFPYGLVLGEAGEIKNSADGIFTEAILETSSNLGDLKEVYIMTSL